MGFGNRRLAEYPVDLCAIVESLAGVEEGERFGMDRFARCEDRVVEQGDVRVSGFGILGAAQRTLAVDTE